MNTQQIAETVKLAIMNDVFKNVDVKKCVIDVFLENSEEFEKKGSKIKKVSSNFLQKCKTQLEIVNRTNKIFRNKRSNYEEILNKYLQEMYGVEILNTNISSWDIFNEVERENNLVSKKVGNKTNKKAEKKQKEQLIKEIKKREAEAERRKVRKEDEYKKQKKIKKGKWEWEKKEDINVEKIIVPLSKAEEERKVQEEKILRNINNIVFDKTEGANYIVYTGLFESDVVEFRVNNTMVKKGKVGGYILKYSNIPFQHVLYHGETIKNIIEKKFIPVHNNLSQKLQEKEIIKTINNSKKENVKEKKISQEVLKITAKDFVVRRTVFKCMHSQHEVVDLVANVEVVSDNGKKHLEKISAGYCETCKIYFIMESTYEKLRNKGVVLCRICDEKSYMKNSFVNGVRLAKESILMQFGYNVSQIEGLSATKRQKILAVMIDNDVLTKSEIISYLDFFISQRQHQSKFSIAVSKWEADREFVEEYRIGEYTQFGVNAIYRR